MHPKFDVRGFMRQFDYLFYITGIHMDCLNGVRVCEDLINYVISCLINKDCRCLCLVDVAQKDWVNHVNSDCLMLSAVCVNCVMFLLC